MGWTESAGGDASGVKLTTTVNVTGNENDKGELTSVSAGKHVEVNLRLSVQGEIIIRV